MPATVAVAGADPAEVLAAARRLGTPVVVKPNRGGKGLGVARFDSADELAAALPGMEPPVERGCCWCRSTSSRRCPRITRAELVGGEVVYALTADTGRGGFQLCPADACAVDGTPDSLFALRPDPPAALLAAYEWFARRHGIEVAGFEFLETAGRPRGHLRRQHQHQLQPGGRGGRAPLRGPRGRRLPRHPGQRRQHSERTGGRGGVWTGAQRREDAAWGARPGANRGSTAVRVLDAGVRGVAAQRRGRGDARSPGRTLRELAVDSERHGFDLALVAELNLNDIKGHRAPAADAWTLGPALAAVTERLELMLAVRPNYPTSRR